MREGGITVTYMPGDKGPENIKLNEASIAVIMATEGLFSSSDVLSLKKKQVDVIANNVPGLQ